MYLRPPIPVLEAGTQRTAQAVKPTAAEPWGARYAIWKTSFYKEVLFKWGGREREVCTGYDESSCLDPANVV